MSTTPHTTEPSATGAPSRPRLGWLDVAAALLLAALTVVLLWKIALTNRVLAGLDVSAYFYPYRDYVSAALREGHLPLWNPYLFMGAPLLANSQAAVLYPLHWPLVWLSTPKQVAWSIVLHIWLAGVGAWLYARLALCLRPLAAVVAAGVFALGGFLGAQVEHLNQLNASVWLPWLLLCLEGALSGNRWRWLALLGGMAVAGLALLAGHTQAVYIVLFGAAVYALLRAWWDPARPRWRPLLVALATLGAMLGGGLLLAAGQLIPTLQLAGLSVRSGGLPYQEAASFSLKPMLVFKAFLPPLAWDPPFSEYVAYIGLVGLLLAATGAWAIWRKRYPIGHNALTLARGRALLVLALLGAFLAFGAYNPVYYVLYKVVPGFDLFRAPARWLLLYSFGAALLAGIGLEALARTRVGRARSALVLVFLIELLLAGQRLAHSQPTAPTAYDSLRTAPAHLLADDSGEPFRFLSISDIRYDPGDMDDLEAMYRGSLSSEAIYDLIVASKIKEVLAYNMPLRYRLSSVDGYDGGLLPIERYVTLERLFLDEDLIWPDGRLRQQLRHLPPARLLSLFNVKYVMTDKTQDVWVDGIYYDLEHSVPLGEVTLTDVPALEATQLGLVSYLTGTAGLPDGTPVATVTITNTRGSTQTLPLRAGQHTGPGLAAASIASGNPPRVVHHWRDNEQGSDYLGILDLGRPQTLTSISVRSLLPDEQLVLRGLTLIDDQTATSRNLSVDPTYELVHSGDVKIYENLQVLPRAFLVGRARSVAQADQALQIMKDASFDPAQEVLLAGDQGLTAARDGAQGSVNLLSYRPEEVQLEVHLEAPAYLVLTDTYYPGWKAEVDGQDVPLYLADLYFRAIPLEPGRHQVRFHYRPTSTWLGLWLMLAGWLAWSIALAIAARRTGRIGANRV
jgi:hypothetical protein